MKPPANGVRLMTVQDVMPVAQMVRNLSSYFLSEADAPLPSWFADSLTDESFKTRLADERFTAWVYQQGNDVIGYLAMMRPNKLYHLFVHSDHHGKGVAGDLWQVARSQWPQQEYVVNASLFAVPVYQKWGFRLQAHGVTLDRSTHSLAQFVQQKDGIHYLPMIYSTLA